MQRYTRTEPVMKRYIILLIMSQCILSCAHVISDDFRSKAAQDVSFHLLIRNTAAYMHGLFIFGGTIVETKNTTEGTEIEVLQNPLDRLGHVTDSDISEGRFIIRSQEYLDPLIYRKEREITVAGILTGSRKRPLGEIEYTYPVFDAEEIYLFKEERYYPYPNLYPYGYDQYYYPPFYYPYNPFRYRPYMYP